MQATHGKETEMQFGDPWRILDRFMQNGFESYLGKSSNLVQFVWFDTIDDRQMQSLRPTDFRVNRTRIDWYAIKCIWSYQLSEIVADDCDGCAMT